MTETTFRVKETGVYYLLRACRDGEAEHFGCPASTHVLIGRTESRYGVVTPVTGRAVKVSGWGSARGVLSVFTSPEDETFQPLKGYVPENGLSA